MSTGQTRSPHDELELVRACLAGDAPAIAEFDRDFVEPLVGVFVAKGLAPANVPSVLGDARSHLLVGTTGRPALGEFTGRGSLRAFVRTAAIRVWLNRQRSDQRRREREQLLLFLEDHAIVDEELLLIKRRYATQFAAAIYEAWTALQPDHRLLLRQHLLTAMSVDRIAEFHRIHRSSAARRLAVARDSWLHGSKRILAQQLRVAPADVDSLLRFVRSQLELDLAELP